MDSRQRYKAFISYSHRDRKAAQWLHRALETYRPPRMLNKSGGDPSSLSLRPIFRDRDELSASLDLNEAIRTALDHSDALIVLCSEASAASRWVDQEVEYFLKANPVARTICVIGPEAAPHAELARILPPSLRAALPPGVEPLAVDLREDGDGRRLTRLKIAARLLGVTLDELVQRDARRRLRVMAAFTAAAVVLAIGMGAMTLVTLKSREIARRQRDETEALVAFMLGDLRGQLEPVGRLDVLDSVSAKVLAYYAKSQTDRLDDKALGQRAKAQTLLGTIREQRGDLAGAEHAFSQAPPRPTPWFSAIRKTANTCSTRRRTSSGWATCNGGAMTSWAPSGASDAMASWRIGSWRSILTGPSGGSRSPTPRTISARFSMSRDGRPTRWPPSASPLRCFRLNLPKRQETRPLLRGWPIRGPGPPIACCAWDARAWASPSARPRCAFSRARWRSVRTTSA